GVELGDEHAGVAGEQRHEDGPLGAAVDEGRQGGADEDAAVDGLVCQLPLARDLLAGEEVDAAAEDHEHVLLPPHDALGRAGGATGVEHVDVVVVEEILELRRHVAVVDVDHHAADLEDRDHRLDGLDGVATVYGHLVVVGHADGLQVVGQAVGPVLEFAEGQYAVPLDQDFAVRYAVDAVLDKVSDGVSHDPKLERVTVSRERIAHSI